MSDSNADFLFWVPPWVIGVLLFATLVLAAALGRRAGLAKSGRNLTAESLDLNVITGAILGLLGLLIAFTYSFVAVRNDARKVAAIDEANALGTAYLRADLAPEPARTQLHGLLRDYTRSRIVSADEARSPARFNVALAESLAIQGRLWPATVGAIKGRVPTVTDALLIQSINEVIDSHGRRLAATRDRLPSVIVLMLAAVAIAAVTLTGYSGGIAEHRKPWLTATLAVTISAVTFIILDMDHSRTGLIRVSQQALVDALAGMEPAAPTTTTAPSTAGRGE